jgi:hypothetical protein
MTNAQKACIDTIRNIDGMWATYSRDWNEFRVTFANDKGNEDVAYYTDDMGDAIATAYAMYYRQ